jgi:hypothetical protein
MSRTRLLVLGSMALVALAWVSPAQAQFLGSGYGYSLYGGYGAYNPYGYGFGGYGWPLGGGTVAGNYLYGQSQVIRAQGEYLNNESQAAINFETARAKDLENQSAYARTYFEKQKVNQDYRDAHRPAKATPEQLARLAKSGVPGRPDRSELDQPSGIILWPDALMDGAFEGARKEMEKLYGERTSTNYGTSSPLYGEVQRVAAELRAELKERIHTMDSNEYMAARKFIDRLAYEARFAPTLPGVAAN